MEIDSFAWASPLFKAVMFLALRCLAGFERELEAVSRY